ncbi:hypothetical protein ANN_15402 [Periplaneta americana]|uniref:Uncharacterized protein n=1 Tax=Periplaneta americana TaxID=6978 RepID=A0ABQ8SH89_PERAM|nr:hypothetical protein ANN_15402 [Periplaneta americana]
MAGLCEGGNESPGSLKAIKVAGYTAKNKKDIPYPNIPSAIRPVPDGPDIPVPVHPESDTLPSASSSNETISSGSYL